MGEFSVAISLEGAEGFFSKTILRVEAEKNGRRILSTVGLAGTDTHFTTSLKPRLQ
jgi:hypothetical protein